MNELLSPLLNLFGMTVLVVAAYFRFRGDVQAQFEGLRGELKVLGTQIAHTNSNVETLVTKDLEQLRNQVRDLEMRLRDVEKKRAA